MGSPPTGVGRSPGFDVGDSENEGFWTQLLHSLRIRGLDGVRLVISDAHTAGQKEAASLVLQGASCQGCRVHFLRNVLAVPRGQEMGSPSSSLSPTRTT